VRAVVSGVIFPTPGGWYFEDPVELDFPDGHWTIVVVNSQFHVIVNGSEPTDFRDFMNEVGAIVQGCVDALSFRMAAALRAEITAMVVDDNRIYIRSPIWPQLLPGGVASPVPAERLFPVVQEAMDHPLVRFALADLRMAMQSPDDTGFHAFRAIESVRQYFLGSGSNEGDARKRSWIAMRTALHLEQEPIDTLTQQAIPRRHGEAVSISGAERLTAILIAREVVEKFIAYLQELRTGIGGE
jgi:hypothetical protein